MSKEKLKSHIFSEENIDFRKEPLFLGKGRNISRLDLNINQDIQKMIDEALGKLWFKTDFDYSQDAVDYVNLSPELQTLYFKNLKFQTLLDSVAARAVSEVFIPCVTNPQLESWFFQHAFFENNIHSSTYAEVIKALPVNGTEVFDDIMVNGNILNRARSIVSVFDDTIRHNSRMILQDSGVDYDEYSHKKSILKSLYALNVLEQGLFKSSFLVSLAFKENGIMNATGLAIKKILLDEIGHYNLTVKVIKDLRTHPEWIQAHSEILPEVTSMYMDALNSDKEWIDYLFETDAGLLGINKKVLKAYSEFNTRNIMKRLNLEIPKEIMKSTSNPCLWYEKYQKSGNVQTAQKETINANYLLGRMNMEYSINDLNFEL